MGYNRCAKPRFYIDVNNLVRAKGGIYETQARVIPDNGIPWIPASEMFHNNGTRLWKTDGTEGWQHTGANTTIDFTDSYNYNGQDYDYTFANKYWQTDMYMRYEQYYPLGTINYFAFLGHNFGPSQCKVEPFICRSVSTGITEDSVPRLNLQDVLDDPTDDSHYYGSADFNDGRFEFFRFITTDDFGGGGADNGDGDTEETYYCSLDSNILTQEECEQAGGDWIINEQRNYNDDYLQYTSTDIGWNVIRFNDNNKSDDTFRQVFNALDGETLGQYNTLGLRIYQYDGEATFITNNQDYKRVPHLNAFSAGWTYVLEHAPDLEIEMTWEFDGISTKTGLGGQNLTNIDYSGPAGWQFLNRHYDADNVINEGFTISDATAWHHHSSGASQDYDGLGGNQGRRVWNLKFSYMHDRIDNVNDGIGSPSGMNNSGLFNDNYHRESKVHMEWSSTGDGFIGINQNFFSRVINGTMGGKLPFLFQPDINDNDEIFLCEFKDNEISFEQVAPNVYNFDLTIREVW